MTSRNIVLTGVSRGLGRALLDGFVREGHTVWGCARSADQVAALQKEYGEPHHFAVVDVADVDAVSAWASELLETQGKPDLLINNAAIINPNQVLWEVQPEAFHQLTSVNINGVYHVLRAFLPSMIDQSNGVIVNFSSGWGRSTSSHVAPYCASKYAIEGMTQALAQELPQGMAAVPLSPGIVNTEMLQSCFGSSADQCATPEEWAKTAVPYILEINAKDNGCSLTTP
jgi:NAD(P)-dependent dehydrogenase (short-subunit alcohol dehydrogenase family)